MNLRGVDLNLLVILDALLDEAHVSRAAARIGLSQPATSNALDRCRHLFEDPLLERAENGMRLTARGEALREPLRQALAQMQSVIGIAPPSLADMQGEVHILMADLLGAIILPPLYRRVADAAPGVRLVLHPWSAGRAALAATAKGTVDVVVSVLPQVHASEFYVEEVLQEYYVVAMRADHPASQEFDLEAWLAWPHVITSAGGEINTSIDDILSTLGCKRRIGAVLPSFLLVPEMLRHTDLIALVPSLCGAVCERLGLVLLDVPIAVPGFKLQLAYHRRREADPAVRFVAAAIHALIGQSRGGGPPV